MEQRHLNIINTIEQRLHVLNEAKNEAFERASEAFKKANGSGDMTLLGESLRAGEYAKGLITACAIMLSGLDDEAEDE